MFYPSFDSEPRIWEQFSQTSFLAGPRSSAQSWCQYNAGVGLTLLTKIGDCIRAHVTQGRENIHKIKKRKNQTGFLIQSKQQRVKVWRLSICCHHLSPGLRVFELICVTVQSLLCKIVYVSLIWSQMWCRVITLHFLHNYDEESLAL